MRKLTTFLSALACSFPLAAGAELIDLGLITQDTDTGLEWLDLTETVDLSVDQVQAGVGGYLADGWRVAHMLEVDQLFLNAGWDGVDDVGNNGSAPDLIVVNRLLDLLGITVGAGTPTFGEGWALTDLAGRVTRPFFELEGIVLGFGRIACTSLGFAERPGDGSVNFANCGMPSDTTFFFIGVYLVRDITDADGDGISNTVDNCTDVANPDQRDTNGDNIGNACDADINNDCTVNFLDSFDYRDNFFTAGDLDTDNNGDNITNFLDLMILSDQFFGQPGPSASGCN